MLPLISANTTQLEVANQERAFGLCVSEALRTEFLNEKQKTKQNRRSNDWEQKVVVSSVRICLTHPNEGQAEG